MNKLFTSIAAVSLGLTMAVGVGTAVGTSVSKEAVEAKAADALAYTIAMKDTGTSSDGSSEKTALADLISSGDEYVTSVSASKMYQAKSGYGVKGGSSSAKGSLTLSLSTAGKVDASKISLNIAMYDSGKTVKVTINGSSSSTVSPTTSLSDYDVTVGGTISSIKVESTNASKNRFYLNSIKVYTSSTKTLSSISVKTAPTKVTYYEGQYFDPTGLVITGTYSDSSTEDFSYADHASDFTFTPATSTALKTTDSSVTIGYGGKTCPQAITVNSDVLNSVTISGNMSTTSYTTAGVWETTGLAVTANYSAQGNIDVTTSASFNFYKDSAMTQEVATPNDLGIGNNQTIYVKATYSGVSNTTGYSQIVSVTKAPSVQNAVFDLTAVSANNDGATITDDEVVITKGVSTITADRGGSSHTKVSNYIGGAGTYVQTRWYSGNIITFESDGNIIKDVVVVGVTGTDGPTGKMATLSSWTGASAVDSSVAGQVTVTANSNTTSLSYTLSGTVRLTGATIHYYAADVPAESITINGESSSSISITPYQTTKLTASVLPLDATDRAFTWSLNPSGDDAIVTIDENGHVEPISGKYGPTVVTATSHDGGFTATCTVTVEHVSYYQAVYYPASTSSATTSGTLPDGESHTFACGNYQSGYAQLTTNSPTASLTLSGYDGQKIIAVLLKMHSNASAGTGSLSIVAGSTTVASIETAPFSDETWNGEYTTDWVLIEPDFTQYDVLTNEDIVISLSATVNSLYLSEIRVQYEASEVDNTAVAFAQLILDDITCDSSGKTAPSSEDWGTLVDLWNDGSTITASGKQTLLDAEAIEHQSPSTDQETIEAAMYKYDYIVGKYNKKLGLEDDYPDFILRNPAPIGKTVSPIVTVNSSNIIPIIVIVSLISVSAIGGYFYIRRRKEHN